MSFIAELTVLGDDFEMGQILSVTNPAQVVLETMVPLGGQSILFIRIENSARGTFEDTVRGHQSVGHMHAVTTCDGETLYAVEWQPPEESLIRTLNERGIKLLSGMGNVEQWTFNLRFPTHDALCAFQEYCAERNTNMSITRIYNPTGPNTGPWYGLTSAQRETLAHAVNTGYYAVPREISTKEVAKEFDISDQAVTERLRRGIKTLVSNTLLTVEKRVERD